MINDDTIKLLRECNSGVKMGVISLDDVLGHVRAMVISKKCSLSASRSTRALVTKRITF